MSWSKALKPNVYYYETTVCKELDKKDKDRDFIRGNNLMFPFEMYSRHYLKL